MAKMESYKEYRANDDADAKAKGAKVVASISDLPKHKAGSQECRYNKRDVVSIGNRAVSIKTHKMVIDVTGAKPKLTHFYTLTKDERAAEAEIETGSQSTPMIPIVAAYELARGMGLSGDNMTRLADLAAKQRAAWASVDGKTPAKADDAELLAETFG